MGYLQLPNLEISTALWHRCNGKINAPHLLKHKMYSYIPKYLEFKAGLINVMYV